MNAPIRTKPSLADQALKTRADDEALLWAISQWQKGVPTKTIGAAIGMSASGLRGTIYRIADQDILTSSGRDRKAAKRYWGREV